MEVSLSITSSNVVTRYSFGLAVLIAVLKKLGQYVTCCSEKIWFVTGIKCRESKGKVMIVRRAFYVFKSSGASWRSMFTESHRNMGWISTWVDSDGYCRRRIKLNGVYYYERLLVI